MAVSYGPKIKVIGGSARMPTANGAHNFNREYYGSNATSGDVRAYYIDTYHNRAGSGETLRIRGIVNGTGVAAGGTVNAIHATGRVAAAKTVSGALNAIRATLEVAGTTPTPGGTLAGILVDSNIVTGATLPANTAFIRIDDVGATHVPNLFTLPAVENGHLVAAHTAQTNTHSIKINCGGTTYYIPIHATATGRS